MKASLRNMIVTGTLGVAALAFGPAAAQAQHQNSTGNVSFRLGNADVRIGAHGDHTHVNVDVVNRRYIPGHYEERQVQVLVSKGHWDEVRRQVLVAPGHWDEVQRQVLVSRGHWDQVQRQVLVSRGHWDEVTKQVLVPGQWAARVIPAQFKQVPDHTGRIVTVMVKAGYLDRYWVPDRYETRRERVWCPDQYATRTERVWCPDQYETRIERIWCPDKYETRVERVWHPDQYETRIERVWVPGCYEEVRTPVINTTHGQDRGSYGRGR
ncbi:MAG: hypothetical protein WD768_03745 [Phycisphaeraceae bacterium]